MKHPFAFCVVLIFTLLIGLTAYAKDAIGGAPSDHSFMPIPPLDGLSWNLQLPVDGEVSFHGEVNYDNAGLSQSNMLYPAPNLIGMLAAVATHAVLSKSSRDAQKRKILAAADKDLAPYQDVLANFSYNELIRRESKIAADMAGNSPAPDKSAGTWLVVSAPRFSMTHDQTTIILDNTIVIYAPGESKRSAYANTVRVISDARLNDNPVAFWTAGNGESLKDESARLLVSSIDIAFSDAEAPVHDMAYKTLRYMEGKTERYERGQLLKEHCGRVLLRSLRGSLMSVPERHDVVASPNEQCGRTLVAIRKPESG